MTTASPRPSPGPLTRSELSAIADGFDRAIGKPLDRFREVVRQVAAGEPSRMMAYLCDDARAVAAGFCAYLLALEEEGRPADQAGMRLSELLEAVDLRVGPDARARSQQWSCSLHGDDADVRSNLGLCGEVLARLAANAVHDAPAGASVRVSAGRDGDGWRMIVDGSATPDDRRETGISGAGLGLAICRLIVARIGGTLSIDGPRACVTFPAG